MYPRWGAGAAGTGHLPDPGPSGGQPVLLPQQRGLPPSDQRDPVAAKPAGRTYGRAGPGREAPPQEAEPDFPSLRAYPPEKLVRQLGARRHAADLVRWQSGQGAKITAGGSVVTVELPGRRPPSVCWSRWSTAPAAATARASASTRPRRCSSGSWSRGWSPPPCRKPPRRRAAAGIPSRPEASARGSGRPWPPRWPPV